MRIATWIVITTGLVLSFPSEDAAGADSHQHGLPFSERAALSEHAFSAIQTEVESNQSVESTDGWNVEVTLWAWMIGLDGTVGAGGMTNGVSASFGDILDASDSVFAFSGRLEASNGTWGGFVDGLYSKLGVDNVDGAGTNIEYEQAILDFAVSYRLWTASASSSPDMETTLDLYAGGRYTDIDLTITPAAPPASTGSVGWVDPIIGAKFHHPFDDRWHVAINGDIGGFGVESDFTWSTTAVLGYRFPLFGSGGNIYLGYRAIGWDFTDGGFTWDVIQHGPILGFGIVF